MIESKTKSQGMLRSVTAAIIMIAILTITAHMRVDAADTPVELTVRQIWSASSPTANNDDTFTYRLKPLKADNPMPPGSTAEGYAFTIAGNRTVSVGPLNFGRADTYRYEIYQVIGAKKPNYKYDTRVYTVEIHVNASLSATKIVTNGSGEKENEILFENSYSVLATDPKLMVDPPVMKTVSGNPSQNSVFEFKLTAQNASQPMPPGSVGGVKTIWIVGSGAGEFGVWSYDRAGIYYYTVSETDRGSDGYTYDKAVYTITDTVTNENGQRALSRVVTNKLNKAVTSMIFNNTYSAGSGGGGGTNVTPKPTEDPKEPPKSTDSPNDTDPAKPADPTKPTDPSQPTDPSNPISPPKPTNPSKPTDPPKPTDPSKPIGPVKPTDPTEEDPFEDLYGIYDPKTPIGMLDLPNPLDPPGTFFKPKDTINPPGSINPPNVFIPAKPSPPSGESDPLIPKGSQKAGLGSPKTGDDTDNSFYMALFMAGATLAVGSPVYMVRSSRKKDRRRDDI